MPHGTIGQEHYAWVAPQPVSGSATGNEVASTSGRAAGRRSQIPVEHGKPDEFVEDPQRLVVGHMLLSLRGAVALDRCSHSPRSASTEPSGLPSPSAQMRVLALGVMPNSAA